MNRRKKLTATHSLASRNSGSTIKDIARVAGVSIATVSYVLNGSKKVTEDVGKRVHDAARTLKYNPNNSARTLRTGRSRTLGLILPDLTNPFFPKIAQAVQSEARSLGYATILFDTQGDPELEARAIGLPAEYRIDGAVWALIGEKPSVVPPFPVVLVDRPLQDYDGVYTDHHHGGRLVADLAAKLGHRTIGLLSGPENVASSRMRRAGFKDAMKDDAKIAWDISVPFSSDMPTEAVEALIDGGATFVFAANDIVALAAMDVLNAAKLRVPADVSLVGFDDISWAGLAPISLTTVHQPFSELGAASMRLLHERIGDPDAAVRQIVLKPQLVRRNSVSPAKSLVRPTRQTKIPLKHP
jgi:LacI family transcriptional regulator